MSLTVSVDVKQHWTVLRHWSQFVPHMSTDIRRHEALLHHHQQQMERLVSACSASHVGGRALGWGWGGWGDKLRALIKGSWDSGSCWAVSALSAGDPVRPATVCSTPGRDRLKGRVSVPPRVHARADSSSARLTFVCEASNQYDCAG